jgi:C4-dicarboxylate-specific signal transduction histidine kinase
MRHIHARSHPICDRGGELIEYRGMILDVTERTLAEEALAEARFELARVMRVTTMGELAASIAHEVNQPLAAVITHGAATARWLAASPPNIPEAQEAVRHIIDDANRASGVIARIREFLQRGVTQRTAVTVGDVFTHVLAIVRSEISVHAVSVQTTLAESLPPVAADPVQLRQVILNLTMNAIEAMTVVTDRPRRLHFYAGPHTSGQVRIAVEDTGLGLRPDDGERMFEAFFTTKATGMGMGLTISRSIIESLGGRLWAIANPVHGATFEIILPAARAGLAE